MQPTRNVEQDAIVRRSGYYWIRWKGMPSTAPSNWTVAYWDRDKLQWYRMEQKEPISIIEIVEVGQVFRTDLQPKRTVGIE